MKPRAIDPDMPVDEIMRRWPATIRVFIRYGMLCIGCPIGVFHTVADASAAHGVDEAAFSADLLAAMRGDKLANRPSAFETALPPGGAVGACGGGLTSADGSPPRA